MDCRLAKVFEVRGDYFIQYWATTEVFAIRGMKYAWASDLSALTPEVSPCMCKVPRTRALVLTDDDHVLPPSNLHCSSCLLVMHPKCRLMGGLEPLCKARHFRLQTLCPCARIS